MKGAGIYRGTMPRRRDVDGPPRSYIVSGSWPDGRGSDEVPVRYVQELAMNLAEAIGDRSLREVGRLAGVDHTTISAVLAGDRWPDLVTVARLEQGLGVRLWPDLTG